MNPWHDVDPGKRAPDVVDCIIEVPRGSRNKYELDKKSGLLRLDRVLYSAVFYPANYGFIPRTFCDDSDPLDILVLGQEQVVPLCIVTARPIGMMQMVDQNEEDDKIIAIHEHDPAFTHYRDISHLPEHTLNELQRFFEDYKILELKQVRIERFLGRIDAHNVIAKSLRLYEETFVSTGKSEQPVAESPTTDETWASRSSGSRVPSRAARVEAARRAAAHLETRQASGHSRNNNLDREQQGSPEFSSPQNVPAPQENSGNGSSLAAASRDAEDLDLTKTDTPPRGIDSITIDDHTLQAHTLQPHVASEYSGSNNDETPEGPPAPTD